MNNENLEIEIGEEVDLIVSHITELGINVIINNKHKGLIYKSDVYEELKTGQKIKGFIKTIREDNKIDVVLQKASI